MFNKKMSIGEGEKYDTTKVSTDGITQEELKAIEKKNKKLIDIYKALGAKDGEFSKLDLALAMDGFAKADTDKDGKLSKKELEEYANQLNKEHNLNIDRKDLKAFLNSVRKHTKNDKKEQIADIIKADADAKAQAKAKAEAEAKAKAQKDAEYHKNMNEIVVGAYNTAMDAIERQKEEAARKEDLETPKNYTVQNGERLNDLLKRSLEAQGIEVTPESLAEAKAEFIKNNPKALHGPKGKEYLYAGDVVKIAGNLEDKANSKEITEAIIKKREEAKAKAEAEAAEEKRQANGEPPYKPVEEKPIDPVEKWKSLMPEEFVPGKEYPAPTAEEVAAKKLEKTRAAIAKKKAAMEKYPLMEKLPNGYSRRDRPGYLDFYFDANGNHITKEEYLKARGEKTRAIDNMVSSPILEELPNGYTKRDVPGARDAYYKPDGTRITKEEYEAAKKAK